MRKTYGPCSNTGCPNVSTYKQKLVCHSCYQNPQRDLSRTRGPIVNAYKTMSADEAREAKNLVSKTWRQNNSEKYKLIKKNSRLMIEFGISLDEYNNLRKSQNFCCAGCERHESVFDRSLAVDHDHLTGKVRGLLCHDCNRGLGMLKDDIMILSNLINYLQKGFD